MPMVLALQTEDVPSMQQRPQDLSAALETADWFATVGQPVSGPLRKGGLVVSSWAEAVECCGSTSWENFTLEQQNSLTFYLHSTASTLRGTRPCGSPTSSGSARSCALHGRGHHVIIECEDRRTEEYDEFYIGRIVALDDETVSIRCFDPTGRWDEGPCIIAYGDITKLPFDTLYINTITKSLRAP